MTYGYPAVSADQALVPVAPSKIKRVMVSLPVEVAERIRVEAEKDRRTVGNWLLIAAEEKLERGDKS